MSRPYIGTHRFTREEVDQKNGYYYVYETESWYDPVSKNTKRKKKLIGKRKVDTDELESTRPKKTSTALNIPMVASCSFNAMLAICKLICDISGVSSEVKKALPHDSGTANKILTLVWYDFLNNGENWTAAENWTREYLELLPYTSGPITENIYQKLFKDIGLNESIKWSIFKKRAEQLGDSELIAWDSTTYVCGVQDVADGNVAKHKDGTYQRVYKVLYIYSITSRQLIAYAKLSGEISDISIVTYALTQLKTLKLKHIEIVMDNGFYSRDNIGELLHRKQHFIVRIKPNNTLVKSFLEETISLLASGGTDAYNISFAPEYGGIKKTITDTFCYKRIRGSKDKGIKAGEKDAITATLSVFVYYSSYQKGIEDMKYRKQYSEVKRDLLAGALLDDEAKKFAKKYMIVTEIDGKVIEVTERSDERAKAFKYHGVLVLLADKEKDVSEALKKYRLREKEEENIKGHKSHSGGDTSKTGRDEFLDGELLLEFLSNSMRESFSTRIRSIENQLAIPNGEREHDLNDNLKIERSLLNWLRKTSFANIVRSYKTTKVDVIKDVDGHCYKLPKPITKRNQLFLELLGIKVK